MALQSPNRFQPATVTIDQGEKVTWTNGGGVHNVQFEDGFEEPMVPSASSWTVERTFTTPGSFNYLCRQHGSSMSGTVNVLPAGGPAPPPADSPPPGGNPPEGSPPGGDPPAGGDPTGAPAPSLPLFKVTLKVSDATPLAGKRLRLFGVVQPARDGRKVQIQKRARNGRFLTIATARLRDAGAAKSAFSVRLRASGDAVFRARVAGDDERGTGLSKTRKVDVHRPRGA
ncbi:MAG: hypothetical protein H0T69_18685 [Thermoleophilaceae bacterium]|nr:hypothetical protein [Thermoleophilaceae bacterium]